MAFSTFGGGTNTYELFALGSTEGTSGHKLDDDVLSYFRDIHSEVAGFCDGADLKLHCFDNDCIYFVSGEYQYRGNIR